jgi:hypothetical protein
LEKVKRPKTEEDQVPETTIKPAAVRTQLCRLIKGEPRKREDQVHVSISFV